MVSSKSIRPSIWVISFVYLAWLVTAELVTVFENSEVGLWLHAGLLAALLVHGTIERRRPLARVWLCLAFAPLIRIISFATPLSAFPQVYGYLATGVPLSIAAIVMIRYLRLPLRSISLVARWSPGQIIVGLSGLALGYVEYLILKPEPLAPISEPMVLLQVALILIVFTGLVEEIIFRGLMQGVVVRVMGIAGVVFVALIFAALHIGYQSLPDLVLVFGVALYFGFYVQRTGSILGVTLAHSLTNLALFLIFPILLNSTSSQSGLLQLQPTPTESLSPTATPSLATFRPIAQYSRFGESTADTTAPPIETASELLTDAPFTSAAQDPISVKPTPIPILVDEGDEGFISFGSQEWSTQAGVGGDVRWAHSGVTPLSAVEWRPPIVECGLYQVQVYIPGRYATTQNARYQISHRAGISEVQVNQLANPGGWLTLGEYEFWPGRPSFLRLTSFTGDLFSDSILIFDAARWIHKGPCQDL